jgi:hypothetical protein
MKSPEWPVSARSTRMVRSHRSTSRDESVDAPPAT